MLKSGGFRHPRPYNDFISDEEGFTSSDHLYMNGSAIFSFTQDKVPILVENTLLKNSLRKEDIDLFVFHQANRQMLDFLRKKIKIEEKKFYYCMADYGNTVSSSIPIALKEAITDKTISNGNKILIAGFGVGYSWGGTVISF